MLLCNSNKDPHQSGVGLSWQHFIMCRKYSSISNKSKEKRHFFLKNAIYLIFIQNIDETVL